MKVIITVNSKKHKLIKNKDPHGFYCNHQCSVFHKYCCVKNYEEGLCIVLSGRKDMHFIEMDKL